MKQQELSRRIQNINRLLGRIEQIIYSLQRLDSDMYPNDYLALCTEAALLSERATCLIRNIVYATSGQRRSMYLGHAASTQEIHIFYHEGIFEVHLLQILCLLRPCRNFGSVQFASVIATMQRYPRAHYSITTTCN